MTKVGIPNLWLVDGRVALLLDNITQIPIFIVLQFYDTLDIL